MPDKTDYFMVLYFEADVVENEFVSVVFRQIFYFYPVHYAVLCSLRSRSRFVTKSVSLAIGTVAARIRLLPQSEWNN